jgi:hypothetical protein
MYAWHQVPMVGSVGVLLMPYFQQGSLQSTHHSIGSLAHSMLPVLMGAEVHAIQK